MDSAQVYGLLAQGADTVEADQDLDGHLRYFAAECSRVLGTPGVAILLLADGQRIECAAAWGEGVGRLAALEIDTGRGPGVRCATTGTAVRCADMGSTEAEWPEWSRSAFQEGYYSALSVPLLSLDERLGAMTVYARDVDLPDSQAARLAPTLAEAVASGLYFQRRRDEHAEQIAHLRRGVTSRVPIEQAKGILAERHSCTIDEAFELLRSVARGRGLRLHDVARMIVDGMAGAAERDAGS
ncbi:MAG TPA: GAF and ANTAR domain-containing protein [Actinospica sp.]|nr:GAF and ANTAR domain-containing protein [Actinospica sp.]